MATTLNIQSFSETNIRERTALSSAVEAGATELLVESTQGIATNDILYVGALGRETCEKAVVAAVGGTTTLTLVSPLGYAHAAYDAVTKVLGDRINIYRALDVDGSVPADDLFSVKASRTINPDHTATYYTDSDGSSAYWYRSTCFNEGTGEETDIKASQPVRGDDFGHYATLGAIRKEAGFTGAHNLSDLDVDAKRREAEAEINSALGSYMTTPFKKPVPAIIETITIKLAGGLLFAWAYRTDSGKDERVLEADGCWKDLASGSADTGDPDYAAASGVSGDFGDEPRMFSVGDRF